MREARLSGKGRDTLEHREELLLRHQLDAEALRVLVGRGALDGPPVAQAVTDNHVGHALVDGLRDGAAGGTAAKTVDESVSYVVLGDTMADGRPVECSASSQNAQRLGIKCLSEQEFFAML